MTTFSSTSKEIIDELKLIQELVTVKKNTSPLQTKIVLKAKFSSITGYIQKLGKDTETSNVEKIEQMSSILDLISAVEFKKPLEIDDVIWLNLNYFRLYFGRSLIDLYELENILDYKRTISIILNAPKIYDIKEVEMEDSELAFRISMENFRLLNSVVNQLENSKIYNYKEWLNVSLKNHYNLILRMRSEWDIMNYSQKDNFKDLSTVVHVFHNSIRTYIKLYSIIRNNRFLIDPNELFNPVDDFQFISAIIKFKEDLDIKISALNDFRDDERLDKIIRSYELYKIIPEIYYHIRELLLSNYKDELISFCNNDIKLIYELPSDYLKNKSVLRTKEAAVLFDNLTHYLYIVGLIAKHNKDLSMLDRFKDYTGVFMSDDAVSSYPELNSLYLLIKLSILIELDDNEGIKLISDKLIVLSESIKNKPRMYFAMQLLGKLSELVTGKITNDEFIMWCDLIMSIISSEIHNAILLESINDYLNTIKDILAGAISEYNLKKINNPDPFDPFAIIIPNFAKLYDENLLYIPFNTNSDKVY